MLKPGLYILCCLYCISGFANSGLRCNDTVVLLVNDSEFNFQIMNEELNPSPILKLFKKKEGRNHKLITAILAFPFPFGIVGLHRIYLGTAPYVPVVYIGTLGGVFGILPLVDFFSILFTKDFENLKQNPHVIMWTKKN